MNCPVCKSSKQHTEIDVHSNGFDEEIIECDLCGTVWAINHGAVEIVKDTQEKSFLEAVTECVESDDYSWACA